MGEELTWTKSDAVREHEGRILYAFTASRGSWSVGVYAHDLEEAKHRLKDETDGTR